MILSLQIPNKLNGHHGIYAFVLGELKRTQIGRETLGNGCAITVSRHRCGDALVDHVVMEVEGVADFKKSSSKASAAANQLSSMLVVTKIFPASICTRARGRRLMMRKAVRDCAGISCVHRYRTSD